MDAPLMGGNVCPSSGYLGSIMHGGAECLHDQGRRARRDRARRYCVCVHERQRERRCRKEAKEGGARSGEGGEKKKKRKRLTADKKEPGWTREEVEKVEAEQKRNDSRG